MEQSALKQIKKQYWVPHLRFRAQRPPKRRFWPKSPPFGVWLWADRDVNGKNEKTGRDLHQSNRPFNTTSPPQTPLAYTWLWTDRDVNGKSEKTGRDLHQYNRPFKTSSPPQTPLAYTHRVDLARFGAQKATKETILATITTMWSMKADEPGRKRER